MFTVFEIIISSTKSAVIQLSVPLKLLLYSIITNKQNHYMEIAYSNRNVQMLLTAKKQNKVKQTEVGNSFPVAQFCMDACVVCKSCQEDELKDTLAVNNKLAVARLTETFGNYVNGCQLLPTYIVYLFYFHVIIATTFKKGGSSIFITGKHTRFADTNMD